ncbi:hypothetical protein AB6C40_10210 [Vibrio splendidus]
MKVYYEQVSADMVSTFTPGQGRYSFKSMSDMNSTLSSEYGDSLELVDLTPELYRSMLASGDFDGYEPA